MQKIIRCSKLKISSGSKEIIYSSLLMFISMIFFCNSIMNVIIPYCIAMFIVFIVISDIFSLSKKVKIKMDVDKLLDAYKLDAVTYNIVPKCIEYIENMYEGKDITIYGNFHREENKFIIYIRYFK
ncbi:hypothetical protein K0040_08650 [Terrisporobacter petrolearius]|uniref:hypothetical protein n=1 Tax=Terrisporobacter petrolearius TaxID=1460447 RepID=UPI001D1604C4|nr:hypothetical protein [Terrisporobacter petrolearius]MCC3864385.1 hypothetical protein [Terrisporobacter petrolearius]